MPGEVSGRGVTRQPDTPGVHPIANTDHDARIADIVFVHGLRGSSHATWRAGQQGSEDHFFWPEELGKELPDCGIWSVGYAAGITDMGDPGMLIDQRSGNVADQLVISGVGTGKRALVFVAHSMGGLVVKSIVVGSSLSPDPRRAALVDSIRGVVFCGTPHRGSDYANTASKLGRYFAGALTALVGGLLGWTLGDWLGRRLGTQVQVQEMERDSVALDLLNDQFLEWCRRNAGRVAVESLAESAGLLRRRRWVRALDLGVVVPRVSANLGFGTVRDVDADHLSLVKPTPLDHANFTMVYCGVRDFIRQCVTAPPPPRVSAVFCFLVFESLPEPTP